MPAIKVLVDPAVPYNVIVEGCKIQGNCRSATVPKTLSLPLLKTELMETLELESFILQCNQKQVSLYSMRLTPLREVIIELQPVQSYAFLPTGAATTKWLALQAVMGVSSG